MQDIGFQNGIKPTWHLLSRGAGGGVGTGDCQKRIERSDDGFIMPSRKANESEYCKPFLTIKTVCINFVLWVCPLLRRLCDPPALGQARTVSKCGDHWYDSIKMDFMHVLPSSPTTNSASTVCSLFVPTIPP